MRDLRQLDGFRVRSPEVIERFGNVGDETCGVFRVLMHRQLFLCIASRDGGWDHVSISLPNRCPTWGEMDALKRKFFYPDEVAMQLHVGTADHISIHPYTLHLWRSHDTPIPLPPKGFV
jgi:hypothetical protein